MFVEILRFRPPPREELGAGRIHRQADPAGIVAAPDRRDPVGNGDGELLGRARHAACAGAGAPCAMEATRPASVWTSAANRCMSSTAGTGIKQLSDHIAASKVQRLSARVFITHTHWDHINTIPFFGPLYVRGNQIELFGPYQGNLTIERAIAAQMESVYFPVSIREFGARLVFRDLREETLTFGSVRIDTILLSIRAIASATGSPAMAEVSATSPTTNSICAPTPATTWPMSSGWRTSCAARTYSSPTPPTATTSIRRKSTGATPA